MSIFTPYLFEKIVEVCHQNPTWPAILLSTKYWIRNANRNQSVLNHCNPTNKLHLFDCLLVYQKESSLLSISPTVALPWSKILLLQWSESERSRSYIASYLPLKSAKGWAYFLVFIEFYKFRINLSGNAFKTIYKLYHLWLIEFQKSIFQNKIKSISWKLNSNFWQKFFW